MMTPIRSYGQGKEGFCFEKAMAGNMLNRMEILRYLGCRESNAEIDSLIDRAEAIVADAARPVSVFCKVPLSISEEAVEISGTVIGSKTLASHLKGCDEGFLFAFTLGRGVDAAVKRASITEMPLVPVLQACAAEYTEACADLAQKELEEYADSHGLYLRPRYSPGYGDFDLSCQRFLFDALAVNKKIGIELTSHYMMVPSKSITAIIGLSKDPSLCHIGKCMACSAKNCPFRKEE